MERWLYTNVGLEQNSGKFSGGSSFVRKKRKSGKGQEMHLRREGHTEKE